MVGIRPLASQVVHQNLLEERLPHVVGSSPFHDPECNSTQKQGASLDQGLLHQANTCKQQKKVAQLHSNTHNEHALPPKSPGCALEMRPNPRHPQANESDTPQPDPTALLSAASPHP